MSHSPQPNQHCQSSTSSSSPHPPLLSSSNSPTRNNNRHATHSPPVLIQKSSSTSSSKKSLTRHSSPQPTNNSNMITADTKKISSLVDDVHTSDDDDDEEEDDCYIGEVINNEEEEGMSPSPLIVTESSNSSNYSNNSKDSSIMQDETMDNKLTEYNLINLASSQQQRGVEGGGGGLPPVANNKWKRNDLSVQTLPSSHYSTSKQSTHSSTTINNTINNSSTTTTTCTSAMSTSITPLHQIPYVHGGYAAAAPLFINNSKFACILKQLLPGAYDELRCILKSAKKTTTTIGSFKKGNTKKTAKKEKGTNVETRKKMDHPKKEMKNGTIDLINMSSSSSSSEDYTTNTTTKKKRNNSSSSNDLIQHEENEEKLQVILPDPVKVMKWAENNPVVSAFGIWNSDSGRRTIKFMHGIPVLPLPSGTVQEERQVYDNDGRRRSIVREDDNPNEEDEDRQSFISGCYTESVVTVGSNFGYRNSMMGYQPSYHQHGSSSGSRMAFQQQQQHHHQYGKPKRRKHPEPECERPNLDSIEVSASGHATTTTTQQYQLQQQQQSSNSSTLLPYNKPAIEWDIFLDPILVKQVDAAMSIVDSIELKLRKVRIKREQRLRQQKQLRSDNVGRRVEEERRKLLYDCNDNSKKKRTVNGTMNSRDNDNNDHDNDDDTTDNDDDDEEENDYDFDILQSHTAAQVEVDRLVSQLLRRTVIAHGSMSQLVLEAMGVAPQYNFGRVVKSSRPTTSTSSPSRLSTSVKRRVSVKAGKTEFSINMSSHGANDDDEWDVNEEMHDFEALLHHHHHHHAHNDNNPNNGTSTTTTVNNGKKKVPPTSSSFGGSKGMFMETWLNVFARTLTLLVKSTKTSAATACENGEEEENNVISKSSSTATSSSNGNNHHAKQQQREEERDRLTLLTKDRPANIGQRGISALFEKMFLRRDSSVLPPNDNDGGGTGTATDGMNDNTLCEEEEEDNSELLTNNDMFSPTTPTTNSGFGMCGMSLCLGMDEYSSSSSKYTNNNNGTNNNSGNRKTTFPMNPYASHKMAQDIDRISSVLGEPLRLVLDLKSRRCPPRVWSRLIDSLRTRGLIIEGIGSFDVDELRLIGKGCSYPLTPLLFFHSVGDLQRACHANEVKNGDTVYFNGGSLMWKRSSIMEAAERGCCGTIEANNDDDNNDGITVNAVGAGEGATTTARSPRNGGDNYSFQPYAYPRSALSDWEKDKVKATVEDYRRHFNLKVGVYVQEFSISAEALNALSIFVNKHGDIYDQGLAFGGLNGEGVKNINGDGYWNQRYMGRPWDFDARPSSEMHPLKPEDHHLVQKAIQAGAWGQVGTIYEVNPEQAGALTVPPPREPCNMNM